MSRNNTENTSLRGTFQGVPVIIVRKGEKNSRVRTEGQTKAESFLVPTAEITDIHKIEKAKPAAPVAESTEETVAG